MAPTDMTIREVPIQIFGRQDNDTFGNWRDVNDTEAYILEGWGEGFMLGALLIMAVITVSAMRKGVLLHKMILLELLFAMSHGTFCFMAFRGYGFYLSSTAALLYCSYFTHNVVAWMKIKPFFKGSQPSFGPKISTWVAWVYLVTLAMTAPAIIFEIFNNFRFFNNYSRLYETVRPYEPLMRDPCLNVFKLIWYSPRFGILLAAIFLALAFTVMDILASILPALSSTDGINPYWKLALVFKCLTDNIMLDDFRSVIQRLSALNLDGATAMLPNSMNILPNKKTDLGEHIETVHPSPSMLLERERPHSLSGRELDDDEVLNSFGHGSRKQSMAAHAVGKLGMKIHKLPKLQFQSKKKPELPVEEKVVTLGANGLDPSRKPDGRPAWEHVDFITALTDPEIEHISQKRQ